MAYAYFTTTQLGKAANILQAAYMWCLPELGVIDTYGLDLQIDRSVNFPVDLRLEGSGPYQLGHLVRNDLLRQVLVRALRNRPGSGQPRLEAGSVILVVVASLRQQQEIRLETVELLLEQVHQLSLR